MFLESPADIAIGGGSAFAGKTFSLLIDSAQNTAVKNFSGVIFRRTMPQIRVGGGLWDTSKKIFPLLGGDPKESILQWDFPAPSKIKFGYLDDLSVLDHQGAEYPYIGFDELTHFSEETFWYLLS